MPKTDAAVTPVKTTPAPPPADPAKQGCATSFINREKDEMDKVCGTKPNPKEEYVQPEREKESGGEG